MSHETMKLNRAEQFDETESEIVVHFKYRLGSIATRDHPGDPDEIEIFSINLPNELDITDLISEAEYEYIEDFLYNHWEDTSADDLVDYKYQQLKDEDI